MKKLLALLMALMMCCTAFAFAEEEAEVPAVEMNVSFEAQTVALGETGLTMQIPADWAVQEVPAGTENAENILLFAVNADQTVSITAQLSAMSFETLLQGIQDAGATEEMLAELYVNENYCLMYTPGDTVLALYTFLDERDGSRRDVPGCQQGSGRRAGKHAAGDLRQLGGSGVIHFVTMMQDE